MSENSNFIPEDDQLIDSDIDSENPISEPPVSVNYPHAVDCPEAHRDTIESPLPPRESGNFEALFGPSRKTVRKNNPLIKPFIRQKKDPIHHPQTKKKPHSTPSETPPALESTPQQTQQKTRRSIAIALPIALFFTAAGATTLTYKFINKKSPFETQEPNPQEENPEYSDQPYKAFEIEDLSIPDITTPKDVKTYLHNIGMIPSNETFNLAPEHVHGKMIHLVTEADGHSRDWKPLKDNVTETNQQTIIAVKIINPIPGKVIHTAGPKPLAVYFDKENNIYYLAYSCTEQKAYRQISVYYKRQSQIFKSIDLGTCPEKNGIDDGVQ